MARLRSAPATQQPAPSTTAPTTQQSRPALKEKTNTVRRKAPVYENDGNTEGLVKDARPRRGRATAAPQQEDEFVMAGGLGQASSDDKTSERSAPPPTTDELGKSEGPLPPTAKTNRRPPPRTRRKIVQNEAQSKVLEGVKQRMQATARGEAMEAVRKQGGPVASNSAAPSSDSLPSKPPPPGRTSNTALERSEYSISPSPPPPGKLNSVGKQRSSIGQSGSALRPHSTPAIETSILALKNFKRRPRQPSMLQMVQQRTASARPSAINAQSTEDPSVFDVEDDEEEFAPDAEGTPLHMSKKSNLAAPKSNNSQRPSQHADVKVAPARNARSAKKRKWDDPDASSSALDALKAKRRKSTAEDLNEELPKRVRGAASITSETNAAGSSPVREVDSEVQVINSQPSSTPPTEPSSPDRSREDLDRDFAVPSTERDEERESVVVVPIEDLDEWPASGAPNGTMAEPASSSPPPVAAVTATQRTDIMADPLTQVSPPRKKQHDKPAKKKKTQAVTTASLQSLLPKRRQPVKARPRKSEYDFDSASEDDSPLDTSQLEDGEDELGGNLRRQTKASTTSKGRKGRATGVKPKSRKSKAATQAPRKSAAATSTRKSSVAKKATKTYGRAAAATASDKENNGGDDAFEDLDENDDSALPDISISMYEAAHSKELEAAKKKFAAVDDWDMEFESMSYEEHRSSSQGWR